jgi:hypothetical protein
VAHRHSRCMFFRLSALERRVREARLRGQEQWVRSLSDAELTALAEGGDPETAALLRGASNAQLAQLVAELDDMDLTGATQAETDARAREIMSGWRAGGRTWQGN